MAQSNTTRRLRSLAAIARCDIALLVFDAMTGIMAQDRRLAGIAIEERKGLIIVGNKWDLVREQSRRRSARSELAGVVRESIPFAAFAPITFLSAKTHRRLGSLMPVVAEVAENLDRRIPTPQLNTHRSRRGARASAAGVARASSCGSTMPSQPATHPPLFVFHCNDPDLVQPHYKRFLGEYVCASTSISKAFR